MMNGDLLNLSLNDKTFFHKKYHYKNCKRVRLDKCDSPDSGCEDPVNPQSVGVFNFQYGMSLIAGSPYQNVIEMKRGMSSYDKLPTSSSFIERLELEKQKERSMLALKQLSYSPPFGDPYSSFYDFNRSSKFYLETFHINLFIFEGSLSSLGYPSN